MDKTAKCWYSFVVMTHDRYWQVVVLYMTCDSMDTRKHQVPISPNSSASVFMSWTVSACASMSCAMPPALKGKLLKGTTCFNPFMEINKLRFQSKHDFFWKPQSSFRNTEYYMSCSCWKNRLRKRTLNCQRFALMLLILKAKAWTFLLPF